MGAGKRVCYAIWMYVLEMKEQLWYNQNPLAGGKAQKNVCVDYREREFLFKLIFLDISNKIFSPFSAYRYQIINAMRHERNPFHVHRNVFAT